MLKALVRRRPIVFTIGALLLLAIVIAVGNSYHQSKQRRRLVDEIRRHGSYLQLARFQGGLQAWLRSWREARRSNRVVDLRGPEIDDEWLHTWDNLRAVSPTALNLRDTRISDRGLCELIRANDQLWSLGLRRSELSDTAADALASRSMLAHLDAGHTKLSNEGLARLPLSQLASLSVDGCAVTATGLQHQLPACRNLQNLSLDGRQCTDETIDVLVRFNRVLSLRLVGLEVTDERLERIATLEPRSVYLSGTSVTDAAISRFKSSLPKCALTNHDDR